MPLAPIVLVYIAPVMWFTIVSAAWGLPVGVFGNHVGRGVGS